MHAEVPCLLGACSRADMRSRWILGVDLRFTSSTPRGVTIMSSLISTLTRASSLFPTRRPPLVGLQKVLHQRLQVKPYQTLHLKTAPGVEHLVEPFLASPVEVEPEKVAPCGSGREGQRNLYDIYETATAPYLFTAPSTGRPRARSGVPHRADDRRRSAPPSRGRGAGGEVRHRRRPQRPAPIRARAPSPLGPGKRASARRRRSHPRAVAARPAQVRLRSPSPFPPSRRRRLARAGAHPAVGARSFPPRAIARSFPPRAIAIATRLVAP
jgi:hypothetical protein